MIKTFDHILFTVTSSIFWMGVPAGIFLAVIFHVMMKRKKIGLVSVDLNLPFGLGNITYQTTEQDRVLAWKMYVQLKTRKAALPFDEDYDVIAEVYDSLYELFPITRELLTNIPLAEAREYQSVADLILRVHNDGLRPHLTKWQAPFRRWWQHVKEAKENTGKTPQEIQRQYPQYKELVEDLKRMNTELSKHAEDLVEIVKASRIAAKKEKKVPKPMPPDISQKGDVQVVSQQGS